MNKSHLLGAVSVCVILLSYSMSANATLIAFNFSGTINSQFGLASDLHTIAPVGSAFTGSFTFNPDAPATTVDSTNDITYFGAITEFAINFGSSYLSVDNGYFMIRNDIERLPNELEFETAPVYEDDYIVTTAAGVPSLPINVDTNIVLSDYVSQTITSAWHFQWMRLDVTDLTALMLSDASIPSTPPNLTPNTGFNLYFQLDCCTGRTEVAGHLDSLTIAAAPIPAAFWLLCSGLLVLGGMLCRKERCSNGKDRSG
jgi:hypothetical protein